MNIVIGSAFRNSQHYLARYFAQVEALQRRMCRSVRVIAVEGDSADETREVLAQNPIVELVKYDHGRPWFGSTEAADRMRELSKIGNLIFDHVTKDDDVLVYVESDLIWDAETIGTLITMAINRTESYDVFVPMVFAGENFYDVWGFRGLDGARWAPFHPYHSERQPELTELSSAGSCLVMRAEVARAVRIVDDMCLVGWSKDARRKGYRIATHGELRVTHPC